MKFVWIPALVIVTGLASFAPFRVAPGGDACARAAAAEKRFDHPSVERLIFFATLEGLYEDGLDNESVDALLARDEKGQYPVNFVWGCSICMPAYEAMQVYRARPRFTTRKMDVDTFGPGLDESTRSTLKSPDLGLRQQKIQELVTGWVLRRRESLRLNPEEGARLQTILEAKKEKGMAMLERYRTERANEAYTQMKSCPFCEGATTKK